MYGWCVIGHSYLQYGHKRRFRAMHAALLTILVVAGADAPARAVVGQSTVFPAAMVSSCSECGDVGCTDCSSGAVGSCGGYGGRSWCCDWWGPMPQTCYNPRFGCYAGAGRTMHRYPAFHGYYYRSPYNYRHYYEYPWHASPHDPQAFLTYGSEIEVQEIIVPTPPSEIGPAAPVPMPAPPKPATQSSQSRRRAHVLATSVQ
jgi:hypothetical protein